MHLRICWICLKHTAWIRVEISVSCCFMPIVSISHEKRCGRWSLTAESNRSGDPGNPGRIVPASEEAGRGGRGTRSRAAIDKLEAPS